MVKGFGDNGAGESFMVKVFSPHLLGLRGKTHFQQNRATSRIHFMTSF